MVINLREGLEENTKKRKERLFTAATNNNINKNNLRTNNKTTKSRKRKWQEKQLYGYYKRQTEKIAHKMTRILLRKRIFMRKTESLLIAAQNNALRANYINAKIDNIQQNWKCRVCVDK